MAEKLDVVPSKKWVFKSYGNEFVKSIRSLQVNDELCDFTITADRKSVRVHKVVLAATSEYFRAMLRGYMKETKEDIVDLGGISAMSLEMIVDFIYSGEMELNPDCLIDMLNAANHLQIPTALELCSDYIISMITFANAEEFVHIADIYSLEKVTRFFTDKLFNSFETFTEAPVFLSTSHNNLISYLQSDRLKIKSEYLLLDCILKWFRHDSSRIESIPALLNCVRYGLISKTSLQQGHAIFALFPNEAPLLQVGLKYHADYLKGHPTVDNNWKVRSTETSLVIVIHGSSNRPLEIIAYEKSTSNFYLIGSDTNASRDCRVIEVENYLYVFRVVDSGGGAFVNCLIRFDPRHLTLIILLPGRLIRLDPAIVVFGKQIYCLGGCMDVPQGVHGNTILDSVEVYNIAGNSWTFISPIPDATHSHAACVARDFIFYSGGITASNRATASPNFVQFNPATEEYNYLCPMHSPRRLHEMETLKDHIYVLGGIGSHSYDHKKNLIPIERYNIDTDQWTILSGTLAGRSIGHYVVVNNTIISLGREHTSATEDAIWSYSVDTDSWSTFAKIPHKTSLALSAGTFLDVNFTDEKVVKRMIKD